jgi:hypothetical protein
MGPVEMIEMGHHLVLGSKHALFLSHTVPVRQGHVRGFAGTVVHCGSEQKALVTAEESEAVAVHAYGIACGSARDLATCIEQSSHRTTNPPIPWTTLMTHPDVNIAPPLKLPRKPKTPRQAGSRRSGRLQKASPDAGGEAQEGGTRAETDNGGELVPREVGGGSGGESANEEREGGSDDEEGNIPGICVWGVPVLHAGLPKRFVLVVARLVRNGTLEKNAILFDRPCQYALGDLHSNMRADQLPQFLKSNSKLGCDEIDLFLGADDVWEDGGCSLQNKYVLRSRALHMMSAWVNSTQSTQGSGQSVTKVELDMMNRVANRCLDEMGVLSGVAKGCEHVMGVFPLKHTEANNHLIFLWANMPGKVITIVDGLLPDNKARRDDLNRNAANTLLNHLELMLGTSVNPGEFEVRTYTGGPVQHDGYICSLMACYCLHHLCKTGSLPVAAHFPPEQRPSWRQYMLYCICMSQKYSCPPQVLEALDQSLKLSGHEALRSALKNRQRNVEMASQIALDAAADALDAAADAWNLMWLSDPDYNIADETPEIRMTWPRPVGMKGWREAMVLDAAVAGGVSTSDVTMADGEGSMHIVGVAAGATIDLTEDGEELQPSLYVPLQGPAFVYVLDNAFPDPVLDAALVRQSSRTHCLFFSEIFVCMYKNIVSAVQSTWQKGQDFQLWNGRRVPAFGMGVDAYKRICSAMHTEPVTDHTRNWFTGDVSTPACACPLCALCVIHNVLVESAC